MWYERKVPLVIWNYFDLYTKFLYYRSYQVKHRIDVTIRGRELVLATLLISIMGF